MAHIHGVSDIDTHFIIDPITRAMKNETLKKTTLILGDHNSERFTFELPRMVEGHDMATCNKVEVHFLNMDAETKQTSKGIYIVDDFGIDPDDEKKVVCSWLIDQNATKYKGVLNFVVRFACTEDGTTLDYVWSTAIYSGVSVADGICNTENVLAAYLDVLEKWKAELYSTETVAVEVVDFDELMGGVINTKYTLEKVGNSITLVGTDGSVNILRFDAFGEWQEIDENTVLKEGTWHFEATTTSGKRASFGCVGVYDGVPTTATATEFNTSLNGLLIYTLQINTERKVESTCIAGVSDNHFTIGTQSLNILPLRARKLNF